MTERLLYDDRLAPLTSTLGFVEASVDEVSAAFMQWQESIHAPLGSTFSRRSVEGDLEGLLENLLPLTTHERRRYLFVPTRNPAWTAYFDNGHQGSAASDHLNALVRLMHVRAVVATVIPDSASGRGSRPGGRYGATVFQMYGDTTASLDGVERVVEVLDDGGRWRFNQDGEALPFEDTTAYTARRVKDRFPPALLRKYLTELGIEAFNEPFYAPQRTGVLVDKHGRPVPGSRQYTLNEVQDSYA